MNRRVLPALLALGLAGLGLTGCSPVDQAGQPGDDTVQEDRKHPPDMRHAPDMAHHGSPDLSGGGPGPVPSPPPSSCDQRHAGVTAIQVLVRIDQYQGLIHGTNGTHEIAYGTVTDTVWVYDKTQVDTSNVQLALNVASATDPTGLPKEIPLSVGQVVEAEGEFIPAATANAHDANGAAAVIHYTHTPCGYIVISGTKYQ